MKNMKTNQKLIVPLFNVEVNTYLQLKLNEEEFVERLNLYRLSEPIPLFEGKIARNINKPIPTPIPTPETTITIIPWGISRPSEEESMNKIIPLEQLPNGFDVSDNLGTIAFRAGSGGLGGFQTITTVSTKLQAKALLIIEFDQTYQDSIQAMIGSTNPYESSLTDSFLDGLRLSTGNEPHRI